MTHMTASFLTAAALLAFTCAAFAQPAGERPLAIGVANPQLKWGPCPPIFTGGRCEIAVLHGDPAKPNADVFLRVSGGTELTPHTHTSAERMVLVGGRLQVDYVGAPPTTLTAGQYAYGPAGLPHRGTCLGKAACTLFIAFEGPVDAVPFQGDLD